MTKEKFDLLKTVSSELLLLGAKNGVYRDFEINTKAGILEVSIYPEKKMPWIACRFDKPKDAYYSGALGRHAQILNLHSGKWNWHCSELKSHQEFANEFLAAVRHCVNFT